MNFLQQITKYASLDLPQSQSHSHSTKTVRAQSFYAALNKLQFTGKSNSRYKLSTSRALAKLSQFNIQSKISYKPANRSPKAAIYNLKLQTLQPQSIREKYVSKNGSNDRWLRRNVKIIRKRDELNVIRSKQLVLTERSRNGWVQVSPPERRRREFKLDREQQFRLQGWY